MRNIRLLVFGSSGQLARSLAELQIPDNYTMVIKGRNACDLTRPETAMLAISKYKPDLVINAAAYTAVDMAETEKDAAFLLNSTAVKWIGKACDQSNIPIIHISTDYVFSGTLERPYRETDPVEPMGVYGQSKLSGEQKLIDSCTHHIILRTAWVHSPFAHNFVKTMLKLATDNDELNIVGDQYGCPTYAPHLAKAIFSLAQIILDPAKKQIPWGIYHATSTGETTWAEFAREIFACSEKLGGPTATVNAITTDQYPTPAARPGNSRLECTRLADNFNISLPDWQAGVNACVKRLADAGAFQLLPEHKHN